VKYGDGGNPSLGCSANDRRSQFPWLSVALHDIKTDLDRRKKFLPHQRVGVCQGKATVCAKRAFAREDYINGNSTMPTLEARAFSFPC